VLGGVQWLGHVADEVGEDAHGGGDVGFGLGQLRCAGGVVECDERAVGFELAQELGVVLGDRVQHQARPLLVAGGVELGVVRLIGSIRPSRVGLASEGDVADEAIAQRVDGFECEAEGGKVLNIDVVIWRVLVAQDR